MTLTLVDYRPTDAVDFQLWLDLAREADQKIADATSPFEHVEGTRYFSSAAGLSGYAVRADGELVNVFSLVSGRGADLVESAVANGAVYLDCFDGYLPRFYARHDFYVVAKVPNWTPGEPDVCLMSLPGYADRHGYTL